MTFKIWVLKFFTKYMTILEPTIRGKSVSVYPYIYSKEILRVFLDL